MPTSGTGDLRDARRLAERLLAAGHVTSPPVPTDLCLQALPGRVQIRATPTVHVRGHVREVNGIYRIFVRESDSPAARRFTIFHELGHLLVNVPGHYDGRVDAVGIERWCNRFAAEVLMPARWVRQQYPYCDTLSALADKFEVSPAAMRVRLAELRLPDLPAMAL